MAQQLCWDVLTLPWLQQRQSHWVNPKSEVHNNLQMREQWVARLTCYKDSMPNKYWRTLNKIWGSVHNIIQTKWHQMLIHISCSIYMMLTQGGTGVKTFGGGRPGGISLHLREGSIRARNSRAENTGCDEMIHNKQMWCDQAKWVWNKKTKKNSSVHVHVMPQHQSYITLKTPSKVSTRF